MRVSFTPPNLQPVGISYSGQLGLLLHPTFPSVGDDGLHLRAESQPAFDTHDRALSLRMNTTERDQSDVPRVVPRPTSKHANNPQKRPEQLDITDVRPSHG